MPNLIVGFDSAWTRKNTGAIAGVLQLEDGTFSELGPPIIADYAKAERTICEWQARKAPTATLVMLDQPTIVNNSSGQRPVENLVSAPVCRRYGGVQPANISKKKMFGKEAPVWAFLERFGGPADPLLPLMDTRVFETYPVLAMIALGWTLPDTRTAGRLPKYNPARKETFSISDWEYVCKLVSDAFRQRELVSIAETIDSISSPRKADQDKLDACICLLVALYFVERKEFLMVGDLRTGYMAVPHSPGLCAELEERCRKTGRAPSRWVRTFRMAR